MPAKLNPRQARVAVQNQPSILGGPSMDDIEKLKHLLGKLDSSTPDSSQPSPTQGMCSLTLSSETLLSLGLNASSDEFRNA